MHFLKKIPSSIKICCHAQDLVQFDKTASVSEGIIVYFLHPAKRFLGQRLISNMSIEWYRQNEILARVNLIVSVDARYAEACKFSIMQNATVAG